MRFLGWVAAVSVFLVACREPADDVGRVIPIAEYRAAQGLPPLYAVVQPGEGSRPRPEDRGEHDAEARIYTGSVFLRAEDGSHPLFRAPSNMTEAGMAAYVAAYNARIVAELRSQGRVGDIAVARLRTVSIISGAYRTGRSDARELLGNGEFRILGGGGYMSPLESYYEQVLAEEGISYTRGSGCVVSEGQGEYTGAYNEVMEAAIERARGAGFLERLSEIAVRRSRGEFEDTTASATAEPE